jgi:hypothetical protein
MARAKIDWAHHISTFESSGMTVAEYCQNAGIKLSTFQTNRYRLRQAESETEEPGFEEVALATELVIAFATNGELTLRGFDVTHLPAIVGAISSALS